MKSILIGMLMFSTNAFATSAIYCSVENSAEQMDVSLIVGDVEESPLVKPSTIDLKFSNPPAGGVSGHTFSLKNNEFRDWTLTKEKMYLGAAVVISEDHNGNPLDSEVLVAVVIDANWVPNSDFGMFVGSYAVSQQVPGKSTYMNSGEITCEFD